MEGVCERGNKVRVMCTRVRATGHFTTGQKNITRPHPLKKNSEEEQKGLWVVFKKTTERQQECSRQDNTHTHTHTQKGKDMKFRRLSNHSRQEVRGAVGEGRDGKPMPW